MTCRCQNKATQKLVALNDEYKPIPAGEITSNQAVAWTCRTCGDFGMLEKSAEPSATIHCSELGIPFSDLPMCL